jgi:P-type E1-E2 ATPase
MVGVGTELSNPDRSTSRTRLAVKGSWADVECSRSLQSSTALVMQNDGSTHTIDSRLLQYGDIFLVIPHARVVTDGVIIRGESEVDESLLTGESKPVDKPLGSEIIAGSTNGSGTIDVLVTRLPPENTISTIAKLVDEAAFSKPPIQNIANKVASYFVPLMIILSLVVFGIQILYRVLAKHDGKSKASVDALQYAIAVLIVSCPCAIALAVPMVVVIAGGVAAKHGVVLKDPIVLEVASKTCHVIFDKTGTLTLGEMEVERAFVYGKYPLLLSVH